VNSVIDYSLSNIAPLYFFAALSPPLLFSPPGAPWRIILPTLTKHWSRLNRSAFYRAKRGKNRKTSFFVTTVRDSKADEGLSQHPVRRRKTAT